MHASACCSNAAAVGRCCARLSGRRACLHAEQVHLDSLCMRMLWIWVEGMHVQKGPARGNRCIELPLYLPLHARRLRSWAWRMAMWWTQPWSSSGGRQGAAAELHATGAVSRQAATPLELEASGWLAACFCPGPGNKGVLLMGRCWLLPTAPQHGPWRVAPS